MFNSWQSKHEGWLLILVQRKFAELTGNKFHLVVEGIANFV
jgi:hypothetical protein